MSKWERLRDKSLSGTSDHNVSFDDLNRLLIRLGFEVRVSGSHHVFRKPGVSDRPNLQRAGSNAKPYQVRQVRNVILKHRLGDKI